MAIYTKTGDDGTTSDGQNRIGKSDAFAVALGTLDELNAAIGVVRAHRFRLIEAELLAIQHELFDIGTAIVKQTKEVPFLRERYATMERQIDEWSIELPPLRRFILPGGSLTASQLHVARTIARRAERELIVLQATRPVSRDVLRYMNRLSDYLFTMARLTNEKQGIQDIEYERGTRVFSEDKRNIKESIKKG